MLKIKDHLTSTKNPKINSIRILQKPRERRAQKLMVMEGPKEIERARIKGYRFRSVYFVPEMINQRTVHSIIDQETEVYSITRDLFEKLSYRGNTFGALVVAEQKKHDLQSLQLQKNPLVLVIEAVEKPGNLGAILRTADAAGVDAVIVCDAQTDIYNPNVIRSSVGCLFTVPVAVAGSEDVISFLKNKGIQIFCTALTASEPYTEIDFSKPSAIVMGTEATGLSKQWLQSSDQNIIIPMAGIADSLNVSTSAAIVTFEAVRQRGK
jgi:TrmH family RNA methyltransferase